jgi:hypothetical protein
LTASCPFLNEKYPTSPTVPRICKTKGTIKMVRNESLLTDLVMRRGIDMKLTIDLLHK